MTAKCTVKKVNKNGTATVIAERKSACEACHANKDGKVCTACDIFLGDDKFEAEVDNSIGAELNDEVMVESPSGHVIATAALIFILPLVIAGMLYAVMYFVRSEYAPLGAVAGVIISFAVILVIEKKTEKKKNKMRITKILNKKTDGANNAEQK